MSVETMLLKFTTSPHHFEEKKPFFFKSSSDREVMAKMEEKQLLPDTIICNV